MTGSALIGGMMVRSLRDKYWRGAHIEGDPQERRALVAEQEAKQWVEAPDPGEGPDGGEGLDEQEGLVSPMAVSTTLSLDQDISEVALHVGVTNYGYTITRDLRANTLSLSIVTK